LKIFRTEQAFISSYLSENPGIFHLGLYYDKEKQSFFWRSGEPFYFTNWGVNQPGEKIQISRLATIGCLLPEIQ
jgi:hypothetical protein